MIDKDGRTDIQSLTDIQALTDIYAERALLDSLLLRPGQVANVMSLVQPDDLHRWWHGQVLSAIYQMHLTGEPIDCVTVNAQLLRRGVHHNKRQLCDLYALNTPNSGRASAYAGIVADLARRRRILAALDQARVEIATGAHLGGLLRRLRSIR